MNIRRANTIAVPATCVVATILLCTGLFWGRWYCNVRRYNLLPKSAREVSIYPSRHVTPERTEDPNLIAPPVVTAGMSGNYVPFAELGAVRYVDSLVSGVPAFRLDSTVYRWDPRPEGDVLTYDPALGLFAYRQSTKVLRGGEWQIKTTVRYAGPEGVSDRPGDRLGRFVSPIADRGMLRPQVVYDRGMRRFFAIQWDQSHPDVRKGPELSNVGGYRPVQVGTLWKNPQAITLMVPPPRPHDFWQSYYAGADEVLVLDASGRIDRLNVGTLEFAGTAGRLPTPPALIGPVRPVRPEDVAAYGVQPLGMVRDASGEQPSYGGCAVASLSREGLAVQLDYYDPNGRRSASAWTAVHHYNVPGVGGAILERPIPSVTGAYWVLPGARALTMMEFILESLHPPVLVLASYFGGPHLEATAGYRSMFLLPDSFVAKIAAGGEEVASWLKSLWAFGCMLPGLLFFGVLAWTVERSGARIGLSRSVRRAWVLGTVVLGLPVYITYRLLRPRATLVTCANCGLGRRPDLTKCHRCGSVWAVPELIPPTWRVLDEAEQEETAPSPAEETRPSAESEV